MLSSVPYSPTQKVFSILSTAFLPHLWYHPLYFSSILFCSNQISLCPRISLSSLHSLSMLHQPVLEVDNREPAGQAPPASCVGVCASLNQQHYDQSTSSQCLGALWRLWRLLLAHDTKQALDFEHDLRLQHNWLRLQSGPDEVPILPYIFVTKDWSLLQSDHLYRGSSRFGQLSDALTVVSGARFQILFGPRSFAAGKSHPFLQWEWLSAKLTSTLWPTIVQKAGHLAYWIIISQMFFTRSEVLIQNSSQSLCLRWTGQLRI